MLFKIKVGQYALNYLFVTIVQNLFHCYSLFIAALVSLDDLCLAK